MCYRVIGVTELGKLRLFNEDTGELRVVGESDIKAEGLDVLPTYEMAVLKGRMESEYYVLHAMKDSYKIVSKDGKILTLAPEQMYKISPKLINMGIKNNTLYFYDRTRMSEQYFDIRGDVLEESDIKTPETICIPSYVRKISKKAFKDNKSLYIKLTNVEVIESKAFINSKVTIIDLNNGTSELGNDAFKGCYNLSFVRGVGALKRVGKRAFADCNNLQYFPFNQIKGDILIDEEAFKGTNLQLICFTNNESRVDIKERAFKNCDFITKLESNGSTAVADYALYGCRGLESIHLGANKEIGRYAFGNTYRLSSVVIANQSVVHKTAFVDSGWEGAL